MAHYIRRHDSSVNSHSSRATRKNHIRPDWCSSGCNCWPDEPDLSAAERWCSGSCAKRSSPNCLVRRRSGCCRHRNPKAGAAPSVAHFRKTALDVPAWKRTRHAILRCCRPSADAEHCGRFANCPSRCLSSGAETYPPTVRRLDGCPSNYSSAREAFRSPSPLCPRTACSRRWPHPD
jgi:hypothetical protein